MAGVYAIRGIPFTPALLAAVLFRVVYYIVPSVLGLVVYKRLMRTRGPSPVVDFPQHRND